jgi:hypothetical protein
MTLQVHDLVRLTAQISSFNDSKFPFTGQISEEHKAAVILLRSELRRLEGNLKYMMPLPSD